MKDENSLGKIDLVNGCEVWVWRGTRKNLARVYKYLEKFTKKDLKHGKKRPVFNYSELSDALGITRVSAKTCCYLLAFNVLKQFVRFKRVKKVNSKGGVKCWEGVVLINFLDDGEVLV